MATFDLVKTTITTIIADISTAGSVYVPINDEIAGRIIEIRTAINDAITGGDAILTFSINGVGVTNSAITIANVSSAAGDVDTSRPTGLHDIAAGEALGITTNGGSTGVVSAVVTLTIAR